MPPAPPTFGSAESSNWGQMESSPPLHAVIIFLITTLGGYAQVQYQSGKSSTLDKHGNIMSGIFVTLPLYAMGLMAEFKLQNHPTCCLFIIKRITPLIGILVAVLLLIILFPLLGLAAFIIWALLVVDVATRLFKEIVQRLSHMTHIHFCTSEATNNFDMEESGSPGIEENGLPV